jgi:hypothetical protein
VYQARSGRPCMLSSACRKDLARALLLLVSIVNPEGRGQGCYMVLQGVMPMEFRRESVCSFAIVVISLRVGSRAAQGTIKVQ